MRIQLKLVATSEKRVWVLGLRAVIRTPLSIVFGLIGNILIISKEIY